jgi:DNA-binding NarL/FixJ family response regulator
MSDAGAETAAPVRVLIADDNAVIRMGLRLLLTAAAAIELVGEATDGAVALEMARRTQPDVVLLDVRMPGTSGLDVLAELAEFCCVLMLTSSEEDETVWTAMRAGARGYLVYGTFDETGIVQNILAAAGGGSVLSPPATRALMNAGGRAGAVQDSEAGTGAHDVQNGSAATPVATTEAADPGSHPGMGAGATRPEIAALLSEREISVMQLLAAGRNNAEIACALFLAPKTVKNHINRIFTKLQVTTRAQAIAQWLGTADVATTGPRTSANLGPRMGPGALLRARPDI